MKIIVFGVGNWDSKAQSDALKPSYEEWRNRVRYFCGDPEMFISTGTYSDPNFNPLNIPLVQNGITKTRPYSKNWNYFKNGFNTGCWNALINKEFDILLHVQCRTLLGEDLTTNLHNFMDSTKQIMAPRWISKTKKIKNSVEVGMMAMKPDAVRIITSFGIRPAFSPIGQLNCETEALELFSDSWYNPYQSINSIRKRDTGLGKDSEYDVPRDEFLSLPMIAAQKHASKMDVEDWCAEHPCTVKGGFMN
jgi:hypothetical protein